MLEKYRCSCLEGHYDELMFCRVVNVEKACFAVDDHLVSQSLQPLHLILPVPCCSYTGLLDTNSTHTYSYNISLWLSGNESSTVFYNNSVFLESSLPHTVDFNGVINGLNITFVDASNLVEKDTWIFLVSSCGANSPLPTGASASLTSTDGTAAVTQLTLDRGFEGRVSGSHEVYFVNQHFTVRAAGTEVQSITIANDDSTSSWTNGSPSYALTFNGSAPTACLPYNAADWEIEASH